jgi:hypothetical protein
MGNFDERQWGISVSAIMAALVPEVLTALPVHTALREGSAGVAVGGDPVIEPHAHHLGVGRAAVDGGPTQTDQLHGAGGVPAGSRVSPSE